MGLQEINNGHKPNDSISLYDVMLLFALKSPDQKKAVAALMKVFSPATVDGMTEYKKDFKTYQDWRNHLVAALDNAQAEVDATNQSIVKQSIVKQSKAKQSHE